MLLCYYSYYYFIIILLFCYYSYYYFIILLFYYFIILLSYFYLKKSKIENNYLEKLNLEKKKASFTHQIEIHNLDAEEVRTEENVQKSKNENGEFEKETLLPPLFLEDLSNMESNKKIKDDFLSKSTPSQDQNKLSPQTNPKLQQDNQEHQKEKQNSKMIKEIGESEKEKMEMIKKHWEAVIWSISVKQVKYPMFNFYFYFPQLPHFLHYIHTLSLFPSLLTLSPPSFPFSSSLSSTPTSSSTSSSTSSTSSHSFKINHSSNQFHFVDPLQYQKEKMKELKEVGDDERELEEMKFISINSQENKMFEINRNEILKIEKYFTEPLPPLVVYLALLPLSVSLLFFFFFN